MISELVIGSGEQDNFYNKTTLESYVRLPIYFWLKSVKSCNYVDTY